MPSCFIENFTIIWPLITQINTSVTGTKFPVLNYSTRNSIDVLLYMHYLYWFSSVMRIAMNNLCICTVYLVYPALGHLSFCYLWLGILSVCHEIFHILIFSWRTAYQNETNPGWRGFILKRITFRGGGQYGV
jgi:hypothetical protein